MSRLTVLEATFIGTVLEGLIYGLYCVLFVLYIKLHTRRKRVDRTPLIYLLSTIRQSLLWRLNMTTSAISIFIDFIAQGVLTYRCWVVWNRQVLVIVVPFILSIISLATSLTLIGKLVIIGKTKQFSNPPAWFSPFGTLSFSLSLAVNAIFTGLLVFKIIKASLAFRRSCIRNPRGKKDLLPLICMLIESGIVLFVVESLWVLLFSLDSNAFYLLSGLVPMIYGIVPTMIVVWVGMRNANNHQTSFLNSSIQCALANENSPTPISGNTDE
ncbi:hypothetical protein BYT27DRAFT_7188840 [Phlegmacium glaucopus]|nr:hypothetical protein BYT27DRAFT_7188840 [Phlegmacium glaucopus]